MLNDCFEVAYTDYALVAFALHVDRVLSKSLLVGYNLQFLSDLIVLRVVV